MREIKFRAWNKATKIMEEVCGNDLYLADGEIYEVYEDTSCYDVYMKKKRVTEQYELMQYIEKKDKNGEEIYEGDVLSFDGNMTADNSMGLDPNGFIYDENSKHVVIWNQELAAWEPKFKEGEHWKYKRDTRGLMVRGDCEIIGNIHDNPGLIEGGAYEKI